MKWWDRLKQLQMHPWLPFFLPVIGTLLYIAIALLLVPSEFGEKSDSDATDSEKVSVDVSHTKAVGRVPRSKRSVPSSASGAAVPGTPANP
jgi:hypothetical protein